MVDNRETQLQFEIIQQPSVTRRPNGSSKVSLCVRLFGSSNLQEEKEEGEIEEENYQHHGHQVLRAELWNKDATSEIALFGKENSKRGRSVTGETMTAGREGNEDGRNYLEFVFEGLYLWWKGVYR